MHSLLQHVPGDQGGAAMDFLLCLDAISELFWSLFTKSMEGKKCLKGLYCKPDYAHCYSVMQDPIGGVKLEKLSRTHG